LKPFRKLDSATAPDGTLLTLFEHDGAFVIRVNGIELMSTRRHHSEDALAELVCTPLRAMAGARVLIGGLGLGFTLRAALRLLPSDARVVVAELVSAVVEWNRNAAYGLSHEALLDPRVELVHGDVTDVLRQHPAAFDAIMMDVDNGADAFTTASNAWLYQQAGVSLAIAALRERGRLAYWSADDDKHFATMLRHAGLDVTTNRVRAHSTTGPTHTLLVAQRRAGSETAVGIPRATADGQGVRRAGA
jgi:spermidine synthase